MPVPNAQINIGGADPVIAKLAQTRAAYGERTRNRAWSTQANEIIAQGGTPQDAQAFIDKSRLDWDIKHSGFLERFRRNLAPGNLSQFELDQQTQRELRARGDEQIRVSKARAANVAEATELKKQEDQTFIETQRSELNQAIQSGAKLPGQDIPATFEQLRNIYQQNLTEDQFTKVMMPFFRHQLRNVTKNADPETGVPKSEFETLSSEWGVYPAFNKLIKDQIALFSD